MGLGSLAAHAGKFPYLRGLRLLNERLPRYFYSAQEESCIRTDTIESRSTSTRLAKVFQHATPKGSFSRTIAPYTQFGFEPAYPLSTRRGCDLYARASRHGVFGKG